mgnify:CR=1 FL=1
MTEQKALEAQEDMEEFFLQYIDKGVKDLDEFSEILLIELKKGGRFKLTIQGFASPLAATDYNVNLTKRRISSYMNYLKEYHGGVFLPYLNETASNGGALLVEYSPYGENTADQQISDNPSDKKKSVYSIRAAKERRVEMKKVIKTMGEKCKVSIRNIRREANDELKKLNKDGLSDDELKTKEGEIQVLTNNCISKVDDIFISKEKDILTV